MPSVTSTYAADMLLFAVCVATCGLQTLDPEGPVPVLCTAVYTVHVMRAAVYTVHVMRTAVCTAHVMRTAVYTVHVMG
jgi:hypothetical protein